MPFKMFYYVDGLRFAMRNGKVYYQDDTDLPECKSDWNVSCCTQRDVYLMVADGTITAVRNF